MNATIVASVGQPQVLRCAAVWGTTVLKLKTLGRGESFEFGDQPTAVLPVPDGLHMADSPLRAVPGGWMLDARGAIGGALTLRGRAEDPKMLGVTGAPVPVMPGDYGLIQYGLFSVFFQYVTPTEKLRSGWGPELLTVLTIIASAFFHAGLLGLVRTLMTPDPLPKPLELTNPDEFAARFGLNRPLFTEPPPPEPSREAGNDPGGKGIKDPGAQDKKPTGGGQKIQGAEGKLGLNKDADHTSIPGEIKPTTHYGGMSEVLDGATGKEIQQTLKSIQTVGQALSGLNSKDLVLGSGPGTSLKGVGGGGGGAGAGVAFGSGTLQTGWGPGAGGGYGGGAGGPGGRGTGGNGGGGSGGGDGSGNGGGSGGPGAPGERKITVAPGAAQAHGGLTPEQVRRVVVSRSGALRACYESEAQRNPNLQGGVTVQWQIDPSGSVTGASVVSSSLGNPRVEGCVVRQVRGWRFPAADAPTTVAAYPFKFGVSN
jgi:TonB family protein